MGVILLLFSLSAVLLLEGMGIPDGRVIAFYTIIVAPFFLFVTSLIKREGVVFPKKLSILFLFFFLFSFFSVISAGNVQRAFEYFMFYLASFLFMVYAYNYRETLKKPIIYLLFVLGAIFSLWSIVISLFGHQIIEHIRPDGYQFVYSRFGSHNHLGDFLLLTLVLLVYFLIENRPRLILVLSIISFLPFYFLSFSRSAYISLAVILSIVVAKTLGSRKLYSLSKVATLFTIIIISTILFFITVRDLELGIFQKGNMYLSEKFNLQTKRFTGSRELYLDQSVKSISEYPILGVGPGNFILASKKNAIEHKISDTAHNIFLDIFVENGLVAGLLFIAIIAYALRKPKFSLYYLLPLVLLLNFQTDYTYRIFSFFLVFLTLVAFNLEARMQDINIKTSGIIISLLLVIIVLAIFISNTLHNIGKFNLSLTFYPLNQASYTAALNSNNYYGDKIKLIEKYEKLFSSDDQVFIDIATYYYNYDQKKSLLYYEKAFKANAWIKIQHIEKIYNLKIKFENKDKAREFLNSFSSSLSPISRPSLRYFRYLVEANEFCKRVYEGTCPYRF